jgi:hypothetical protein
MGDLTFVDTLLYCISTPELVSEFNRLSGCSLGVDKRSPLERMIDKATGYEAVRKETVNSEFEKFVEFVYEFVWTRLPPDER